MSGYQQPPPPGHPSHIYLVPAYSSHPYSPHVLHSSQGPYPFSHTHAAVVPLPYTLQTEGQGDEGPAVEERQTAPHLQPAMRGFLYPSPSPSSSFYPHPPAPLHPPHLPSAIAVLRGGEGEEELHRGVQHAKLTYHSRPMAGTTAIPRGGEGGVREEEEERGTRRRRREDQDPTGTERKPIYTSSPDGGIPPVLEMDRREEEMIDRRRRRETRPPGVIFETGSGPSSSSSSLPPDLHPLEKQQPFMTARRPLIRTRRREEEEEEEQQKQRGVEHYSYHPLQEEERRTRSRSRSVHGTEKGPSSFREEGRQGSFEGFSTHPPSSGVSTGREGREVYTSQMNFPRKKGGEEEQGCREEEEEQGRLQRLSSYESSGEKRLLSIGSYRGHNLPSRSLLSRDKEDEADSRRRRRSPCTSHMVSGVQRHDDERARSHLSQSSYPSSSPPHGRVYDRAGIPPQEQQRHLIQGTQVVVVEEEEGQRVKNLMYCPPQSRYSHPYHALEDPLQNTFFHEAKRQRDRGSHEFETSVSFISSSALLPSHGNEGERPDGVRQQRGVKPQRQGGQREEEEEYFAPSASRQEIPGLKADSLYSSRQQIETYDKNRTREDGRNSLITSPSTSTLTPSMATGATPSLSTSSVQGCSSSSSLPPLPGFSSARDFKKSEGGDLQAGLRDKGHSSRLLGASDKTRLRIEEKEEGEEDEKEEGEEEEGHVSHRQDERRSGEPSSVGTHARDRSYQGGLSIPSREETGDSHRVSASSSSFHRTRSLSASLETEEDGSRSGVSTHPPHHLSNATNPSQQPLGTSRFQGRKDPTADATSSSASSGGMKSHLSLSSSSVSSSNSKPLMNEEERGLNHARPMNEEMIRPQQVSSSSSSRFSSSSLNQRQEHQESHEGRFLLPSSSSKADLFPSLSSKSQDNSSFSYDASLFQELRYASFYPPLSKRLSSSLLSSSSSFLPSLSSSSLSSRLHPLKRLSPSSSPSSSSRRRGKIIPLRCLRPYQRDVSLVFMILRPVLDPPIRPSPASSRSSFLAQHRLHYLVADISASALLAIPADFMERHRRRGAQGRGQEDEEDFFGDETEAEDEEEGEGRQRVKGLNGGRGGEEGEETVLKKDSVAGRQQGYTKADEEEEERKMLSLKALLQPGDICRLTGGLTAWSLKGEMLVTLERSGFSLSKSSTARGGVEEGGREGRGWRRREEEGSFPTRGRLEVLGRFSFPFVIEPDMSCMYTAVAGESERGWARGKSQMSPDFHKYILSEEEEEDLSKELNLLLSSYLSKKNTTSSFPLSCFMAKESLDERSETGALDKQCVGGLRSSQFSLPDSYHTLDDMFDSVPLSHLVFLYS
ncbi:hypothetical protein CSUI_009110 [Cystoisospora suis]|uniref:Uncharacterized protein n=1 Tax=Cystoisospora suis TaxID=483139 RepID=A0A2C6KKS6_9APIC|nr:hypothetical protein CSUI_009110 [Cystoisospora suis]